MVRMAAELQAMLASSRAHGPLLMSMAEIADLAGVQRPVVTTWRRRHPDFPSPVNGTAIEPLFDAGAVAGWLIATGRDKGGQVEADLCLYTLAGLNPGMPPLDLLALVTALICLRSSDDEPLAAAPGDLRDYLMRRAAQLDPYDLCLLSEVALLPEHAAWLPGAVDDLIEAAWGCQQAFERVMGAHAQFKAGDVYARTVAPPLAWLIAQLSGVHERAQRRPVTVCDPAAGPGDLLAATADVLGPDHEPVLCAADADPYLARLAGRRLLAHGTPLSGLRLVAGGEPPEEWGNPDVIVTQIPYAPGESRSADEVIDALDDIALRLAPGCSAVVLGPADVLAGELRAYSPAERARAKLLSSGMVEAVIRLPGGLVPFRPGYETALWVLTSAYDSPWRGWVLLADVSDRDLSDQVAAALVEDVVTWRREGYRPYAHSRTFGVQVRVSDLVGVPGPLTARRQAGVSRPGTAGADRVTRVAELEAILNRPETAAAQERQPFRGRIASGHGATPPVQTIGSLVRSRRLIMKPGTRLNGVQAGAGGHHDVIGPPELLGRARRGDRRMDRVVLASQPRARLTEPGDVIVTVVPEFAVMADHEGMAVVEFPAKVLRIPADERQSFTPRTLAALLAGRIPSLRPASAVRPRRLEEHAVALLSPAEVAFLDEYLAGLDAREEAARRELGLLAELRDVTTCGLLDGTLTFTDPPPIQTGQ